VVALTDLALLFRIVELGRDEFGVPLEAGGLHAGEWETSMLASIHPELVRMDRAEAGYVGELEPAIAKLFESGMKAISDNGAVGDPTSPAHGNRYWEAIVELALAEIEGASS
jgi:creatinine amidohydrolase